MITNAGKRIIMHKLAGMTDPCFDYLAVGTGSPVNKSSEQVDYPDLKEMIFEVDRFPVTSVTPFGDNVVHVVAEIPRSLDIAVSELALFTHNGNTFSGSPSQLISGFGPSENWYINGTSLIEPLNDVYPPAGSGTRAFIVSRDEVQSDNTFRYEIPRVGSYGVAVFPNTGVHPGSFTITRTLPSMNLIAEVGDSIRLAFILGDDTGTASPLSIQLTIGGTQAISRSTPINVASQPTAYNPSSIRPLTIANQNIPEYATLTESGTETIFQAVNPKFSGSDTEFNTTYPASLLGNTTVTINYTGAPDFNQYMVIDFPISQKVDFSEPQSISLTVSNFPTNAGSPPRMIFDGLRFVNKHDTNPYYGMVAYSVARNADMQPLILDQSGSSIVGMEIRL